VLILQTLPPIVLGLWRTGMHRWALLAGWAVGIVSGLLMLYNTANATTGKTHFGGPQFPLSKLGFDTDAAVYTGILAVAANLVVVLVLTVVLRAVGAPQGEDVTRSEDYEVERGDPGTDELPATPEQDERAEGGRFAGATPTRTSDHVET